MTDSTKTSSDWPVDIDTATLEQIISIIAEDGMVERSAIKPDATLESLGLQSVDVVVILMSVEEKLGIYVPVDNDLAGARNLAEFISAIAKPAGRTNPAGVPISE